MKINLCLNEIQCLKKQDNDKKNEKEMLNEKLKSLENEYNQYKLKCERDLLNDKKTKNNRA